ILPYHAVAAVHRDGDVVTGARVHDVRADADVDVEARVTVNAAGAWAGRIAGLAGIEGVRVLPGRGIMIAVAHRLVDTCVNRCQMPTDGDIIVPIRTVSVIGTTDVHTEDPDDHTVDSVEVQQLLDDGEKLVPGFRAARALRVWTGVRPLVEDAKDAEGEGPRRPPGADPATRDVTRAHALLDHERRDGVRGFVTITGGKLTTFRLMAQETVDAVCAQLRVARSCTTATEPLPGSESGEHYRVGERLARKEARLRDEQVICECELVARESLEAALARAPGASLDDIRRRLRLGMGPCQGGFCIYRAAGIMHGRGGLDADAADAALLDFLQERWKGVSPVLHGDQLRQARLDDWIFQGVLDVAHLPAGSRDGAGAPA
ncbi:MAG: FAD-dependent oxidoreductase, partial [Solirubrobacteraceae bacterium]